MRWVEIGIQTRKEEVEDVAFQLARWGRREVAVEQWPGSNNQDEKYVVKIYLPFTQSINSTKLQLLDALQSRFKWDSAITERIIKKKDWFKSIRQQFNIIEVGDSLMVKATWADQPVGSDRKIIELDPGYAFGTGLHPTTRLCLIRLEKEISPGMHVLDLGTGSGILAIAAAMLNASSVLALDTDPNAIHSARNNIVANCVENVVKVKRGSLSQNTQKQLEGKIDLIAANIISEVIADLASGFARVLKPGGKVIASGINSQGLDKVLIHFALADLSLEHIFPEGEWYAVVGTKKKN